MSSPSTSRANISLEGSIPEAGAPLESILCTEELQRRPSRPPDYEKENRALVALVSALADSPRTIFQTLAETILEITECDSAGLSLLTRDGKTPNVCGERFYWPAIAGLWNPHVGGGTPRNFGPCGDVLDQNRTLLFRHFELRYPYLLPVNPAAEECLLVPFYVGGEAVGTIWGIMHSDRRKFDAEDDRVMASLGKFASSAYQAVLHIENLKFQVAEREKAEAEVRRYSEERHRVVVETASDAVISLDETSTILLANPATTRIFGYDPAELIGKPLSILMPEFLRKLHEAGFKSYLATGQRHINWQGTELVGLRKNGQEFPVEVSFGELIKDGHRIFTGFIRDISERRQAQRAIQNSQAELARVSRLTTMGELAASIAHEVNQPLTAVNNNSNACLRLLANQSLQPDVLRRALEEIVADGTRASAIIARIRAFIKKTPSEKNRLDVNEVIGEVLVMMGHGFQENRILLQSEPAQTLPPVLGDRVQLQQVLLNLIVNAIEAMSAVTDRPRLLCVQSRIDESGEILVAVRDSGTGLGSESDRVFTPFFTTKTNGIGMGLAISRSLVESHGGQLWATPNSPYGAIFSFTLPAAAGSPP